MTQKSVEISGTVYELDDNPSMGTVKHVQSLQIDMIRDVLSDEQIAQLDSVSESDLMSTVLEENGVDALKNMTWSRGMMEQVQTISLATDQKWTTDKLDDLAAQDFKNLLSACKEVLGGTASDFLEELGIVTSLMENSQTRDLSNQ